MEEKNRPKFDEFDEFDDDEDEAARKQRIIETYNPMLIEGSRDGNLDKVREAIKYGAEINSEDNEKKWTPIIWAACFDRVDVVRELISLDAASPFLSLDDSNLQSVELGKIKKDVRPTPLQWACIKGNHRVIWLLLKERLDWRELDSFANNCLHLAASSNSFESVEVLIEYGVTIHHKNSRGHKAIDLTTEPRIIKMLRDYEQTEVCPITNHVFGPEEVKYLCHFSRKFYSHGAIVFRWIYDSDKNPKAEQPMTVSQEVHKQILESENSLKYKIDAQEEAELREEIKKLDALNYKINCKLYAEAQRELIKLETQNALLAYINNLKVIDNYKTILKSKEDITRMIEDADNPKDGKEPIKIDGFVRELARAQQ